MSHPRLPGPEADRETTASDVIDRDELAGERHGMAKFADATNIPSRILDVNAAAAANVGTEANHGSSRKVRHARWSYVQA